MKPTSQYQCKNLGFVTDQTACCKLQQNTSNEPLATNLKYLGLVAHQTACCNLQLWENKTSDRIAEKILNSNKGILGKLASCNLQLAANGRNK